MNNLSRYEAFRCFDNWSYYLHDYYNYLSNMTCSSQSRTTKWVFFRSVISWIVNYMRLNPCTARSVYIQFQATNLNCTENDKTVTDSLVSSSINMINVHFSDKHIFCRLKLVIPSAILASNDEKWKQFSSII